MSSRSDFDGMGLAILGGCGVLTLMSLVFACAFRGAPPESATQTAPTTVAAAVPTHCIARGALPDPACTPGAVMDILLDRVCHESTKGRRHVTATAKRVTFEAYGLAPHPAAGAYEVDHLVPLELGGDNALANLWPEPAEPRPGFHEKDAAETYLHRQVCSGAMPLAEAQRRIATDWVGVWREMGHAGAAVSASDSDDE